jgi:hypothetical protein
MNGLKFTLIAEPTMQGEIASLRVHDENDRLMAIIHVTATYGGTLEIIDFDRYSDNLGYLVKTAKILKSAKATDIEGVKAALDGVVKYN